MVLSIRDLHRVNLHRDNRFVQCIDRARYLFNPRHQALKFKHWRRGSRLYVRMLSCKKLKIVIARRAKPDEACPRLLGRGRSPTKPRVAGTPTPWTDEIPEASTLLCRGLYQTQR